MSVISCIFTFFSDNRIIEFYVVPLIIQDFDMYAPWINDIILIIITFFCEVQLINTLDTLAKVMHIVFYTSSLAVLFTPLFNISSS